MGTTFKRRGRTGKHLRNYSICWMNHMGRRVTKSSGTSDKRVAQRVLAEKEAEVALILSGAVDPQQECYRKEASKSARAHLDDYLAACVDKEAHSGLKEKRRHLDWLLDVTGAVKLSDILPDVLDARLSALSEQGKSARTVNLKLECARAFLNWCVRNGRLRSNPLKVVPRRNEVVDKRVERRALTDEETRKLLAVAREKAAEHWHARRRPLWYLFPLLAGLRRGDMVNLTWGAIDTKARALTIRGGKARRRVDRMPLHPELVAEIEAVRPTAVLPSARVFPKVVSNATRRSDFERAGIVLVNDRGEHADLHALRVTFGTRLALSGVPPAVHQQLMRHSTIELTMRYYMKLGLDDLETHEIDFPPGVEGTDPERLKAQ